MPPLPQHPLLELAELGDVTLIRCRQSRIIDEQQAQQIGDLFQVLSQDQRRKKCVVNLEGVEAMTSSMVGKLIALHKRLRAAGGQLVVCSVSPELCVFEIGGLKKVFDIRENQAAAIMALQS